MSAPAALLPCCPAALLPLRSASPVTEYLKLENGDLHKHRRYA